MKNSQLIELSEALKKRQTVQVLFSMDGESINIVNSVPTSHEEKFKDALYEIQNNGAKEMFNVKGNNYYLWTIASKPKLTICGGGHVGYYVARIGTLLNFDVTVIDDREMFANKDRFSEQKVICKPFKEALKEVPYGEGCYFVIVTRGHIADGECLETILKYKNDYVGMIGSKKKINNVYTKLKENGIKQDTLDTVYAPIGLSIGANTPAEIGVCIGAQLVDVRSKTKSAAYIDDGFEQTLKYEGKKVMSIILEAHGSSPRSQGTTMMVCDDSTIKGTVGGGSAENLAIEKSKTLIGTGKTEIVEYNMNQQSAMDCGMVCGGKIKLLMTDIKEG